MTNEQIEQTLLSLVSLTDTIASELSQLVMDSRTKYTQPYSTQLVNRADALLSKADALRKSVSAIQDITHLPSSELTQ
jgi:hypothetical protein